VPVVGAEASHAELTEFELKLSLTLTRYVSDLATGRFSPKKELPQQHILPQALDPLTILTNAADAADIGAYLRGFAPPHPAYAGLREALARHRALAAAGGWPMLPDGPTLKPGMVDERVPLLRWRLQRSGDFDVLPGPPASPDPVSLGPVSPGPASPAGARSDLAAASLALGPPPALPEFFDLALQQAVERFQRRHGLEADGLVGRSTRAALNVSPEERINQIILNMERWRWMPRDLGSTHVLVNMAGFELDLIVDRRPTLSMRVVVGTPYQSTPVFSEEMTYLEFNPYWNIPHSIASKEILPQAQRDPSSLTSRGIRVFAGSGGVQLDPWAVDWWSITPSTFPFRLRQDPGPNNPLGRVKFMLPNHFSVYLHDTSSPSLFQRTVRTFSHGCIRVEKPAELAAYVLRHNEGWDLERVQSVMKSGARRIVTLKQPVPVHLTYVTAWAADDGTVQFRNDVYGRDSGLFKALFGTSS
jgi:murein L,D-transpeptidase YcbB/YkuD